MLRNNKQAEGDDQLFAASSAGSKAKKRKVVVDGGDEDSFVSVEVGGKTLNIKKAARTNEDICVHWSQGSSRFCLSSWISLAQVLWLDPTTRSYKKTGQIAGNFEKYYK